MHPTGFRSWKDYFNFALARSYIVSENNQPHSYETNLLEKVGHLLTRPILEPLHFFTKNIKHPIMILALSVSAIAIATIAFYPTHFVYAASKAAPFILSIKPWMLKGALYAATEATILGLASRALGRISNQELLESWSNQRIMPLHVGDVAPLL